MNTLKHYISGGKICSYILKGYRQSSILISDLTAKKYTPELYQHCYYYGPCGAVYKKLIDHRSTLCTPSDTFFHYLFNGNLCFSVLWASIVKQKQVISSIFCSFLLQGYVFAQATCNLILTPPMHKKNTWGNDRNNIHWLVTVDFSRFI
jgi:hypothetical protein